jgi:hypothetical protein
LRFAGKAAREQSRAAFCLGCTRVASWVTESPLSSFYGSQEIGRGFDDSEVYDAFVAAGAPEDKAREAAEALADYENRFTRTDPELLVVKWMVGFVIALDIAILVRVFVK